MFVQSIAKIVNKLFFFFHAFLPEYLMGSWEEPIEFFVCLKYSILLLPILTLYCQVASSVKKENDGQQIITATQVI